MSLAGACPVRGNDPPLLAPKHTYPSLALVLIALLLAACAGPQTSATPTLLPSTIAPTQTSKATLTITLTATPTLTPTSPPRAGQAPYTSEVEIRLSDGSSQTQKVRYLLYLPEGYFQDAQKKWPMILYLHGSGEAGTDLNLLKRNGLPKMLDQNLNFPLIVVSPQIPAPPQGSSGSVTFDVQNYLEVWGWAPHIRELDALIELLQTSLRVDPQHLYLTGVSLGGFGAWHYALQFPHRFAAVAPLAGGYRFVDNELPPNLCDLKDLPIWAFHGALDGNVSPERSQAMVDGLKACDSTAVRFTLYPDHSHNVWDTTYADPEFWDWLLAQEKK